MSPERLCAVPRKDFRLPLRASYRHLLEADFRVLDDATRNAERFEIRFGSSGTMRAVPVQIRYQPHWWFRAPLHLGPASPGLHASALITAVITFSVGG